MVIQECDEWLHRLEVRPPCNGVGFAVPFDESSIFEVGEVVVMELGFE